MAIYELKTFADIYTAVREELKVQSGDTTSLNRIKRNINLIYLDEVIPATRWPWLNKTVDVSLAPYFSTGTATATQNSRTITLSSAPTDSKTGYWFSVDNQSKKYKIFQHTAGATTVLLETPYSDATASSLSFKIWTDAIPLPVDCRETVEVTQDGVSDPLTGVGLQEFRRICNANPKFESDYPLYYHTYEATDPAPYVVILGLPATATRASAGLVRTIVFGSSVASYLTQGERIRITGAGDNGYNGEFVVGSVSTTTVTFTAKTILTESSTADVGMTVTKLSQESADEHARQLLVYPSLTDTYIPLHVDYTRKVYPFENDTDEPVIPLEDRVVLFYGALELSWGRERNDGASMKNEGKYGRKLAAMMGRYEDSTDMAVLTPSRRYLASKRNPRWRARGSKD